MRLRIRHLTTFRYDQPITHAIHALRMMPRRHHGQRIEDWSVTVTGRRQPLVGHLDGYGTWVHLHTRDGAHDATEIVVSGIVELLDRNGVVSGTDEPLPPCFFLRQTELTRLDAALAALAAGVPVGGDALGRLHGLMGAIGERIAVRPAGDVTRLAAKDALAAGTGTSQDLAHVMAACAQALGFPARYVSGYLHDEAAVPQQAGHAWTEVHVPDIGWVGFDATSRSLASDRHVRVAAGLDYWSAAPVRGLWRGRAEEAQSVMVQVAAAEMTQ